MRSQKHLFAAILACLVFAFPSLAAAADSYRVSATVSHSGKWVAAPSAVVLADKPASIEVPGDDGYTLAFTVTDLEADKIQIAVNLESAHGSMAPTMVIHPDKPATVSVGDLSLEVTVGRSGG